MKWRARGIITVIGIVYVIAINLRRDKMEDREELQEYLKYIYNSDFEEIMNVLEDIQTLLLFNGVDFPLDIEHFKNKANDLICKADELLEE